MKKQNTYPFEREERAFRIREAADTLFFIWAGFALGFCVGALFGALVI